MHIKLRHISLPGIGFFLFLLVMYSIGTVTSITVSWTITLLLLALSIAVFFINYTKTGGKHISNTIFGWAILTALCFWGFLIGNSKTLFIFYAACLVLLIISESIGIETLFINLKWIKYFGLLFAVGCYWQFLFPSQYYSILYPRFGPYYRQSIRRQFTFHKMCTGFTSQTAVAAQFIVLGIMVVLYLYPLNKTKAKRVLSIIEIVFLAGGLLLTGKRSPLLNLSAALIIVDMLTVRRDKRGNRLLAVALGLIIALTAFYFLSPLFSGSRNSILRFMEYANAEDIGEMSNGRFALFSYAISEFLRRPILGIGWENYSRLYGITGVHNIYLQLLCECGIVGFVLAVYGMLYALFDTIHMLKIMRSNADSIQVLLLKCSVFIQIYTLVYGLFGNPLYDQNYLMMYCMGLLFATVVYFSQRSVTV